jgi:hypothetical protein
MPWAPSHPDQSAASRRETTRARGQQCNKQAIAPCSRRSCTIRLVGRTVGARQWAGRATRWRRSRASLEVDSTRLYVMQAALAAQMARSIELDAEDAERIASDD